MTIKTIHGQFKFKLQRFINQSEGTGFDYFTWSQQCQAGYESERLQEWVCYLVNRLSYAEVSRELERHCGQRLLSANRLQELVIEKASQISVVQAQQGNQVLSQRQTVPELVVKLDLYAPDSEEVLLMCDGIQVKRQKASRGQAQVSVSETPQAKSGPKRVNTDVMMLQQPTQAFRYLIEGIAQDDQPTLSLVQLTQAALIEAYGQRHQPLPLVAITDGARHIRVLFEQIFDQPIPIILDWYHLQDKCRQLLSMIARNKAEKETHLQSILAHLWQGRTTQALAYLKTQVLVRNQTKFDELITYLSKHAPEIIDYERRQLAGKTIGSGRMEKGVDLTVGRRQKRKGMSWSDPGSRALALLKMIELNGQWASLWAFS